MATANRGPSTNAKVTRGTNPTNRIDHAETLTIHAIFESQTASPQTNRLNAANWTTRMAGPIAICHQWCCAKFCAVGNGNDAKKTTSTAK